MEHSFKHCTITITDFDYEFSRKGIHTGDTLKGLQEFIDGKPTCKVFFGAKGDAADCVGYLGQNCVKH